MRNIFAKSENYFTIKKINPVIRYLTISDILIIGGGSLVSPIFAVFITDTIKGGTLEVVGLATAVFLVTKSVGQIPIAHLIDKVKGEKDDFIFLLFSTFIISVLPLAYMIISTPFQLYIVQFVSGLFTAASFPTWMAIFTRHIDKEHEGIEWAVYYTLTDLSSAGFSFLGGVLAYNMGFNNLFIVMTIISFVGSAFLLGVYKYMRSGYVLFPKRMK